MESTQLKPRELNSDILSSIKAARQKLSVDLTKQNSKPQGLYRPGNNLMQKTIEALKLKIQSLERDKQDMSAQAAQQRKCSQHQVDVLKQQLTKYIEKDFEQSMGANSNVSQMQAEVTRLKEALARRELEMHLMGDRLRQAEVALGAAQEQIKKLGQDVEQVSREKEKHIELSINDKITFEEEIRKCAQESEVKLNRMRKLEQDNINLRKEIHSLSTQHRAERISKHTEKKTQEEYEFDLKQLTQKFNSKVAKYEKQMTLLRKTINTLKDRSNDSDNELLAHTEKEVEAHKQKILELEKQIAFKNIEMDKLSSKLQHLSKIIQQKDSQFKKLQQSLNKKQQSQRNLLNKLAKSGLQPRQQPMTFTKSKFNLTTASPKFFNNDSDTPTFMRQQQTQPISAAKFSDRGYSSDKGGGLLAERRSSLTSEIVREERAVADLRATHKNLSTDMSLSQIMQEIKRKNEKINNLRQGKN